MTKKDDKEDEKEDERGCLVLFAILCIALGAGYGFGESYGWLALGVALLVYVLIG